jgi:anaerobic ribonucleoside-triphosphate reductase activating protein
VHSLLESSCANGPGLRVVLWLQGCPLGCPGCFNPQTHARAGGQAMAVDDLADRLDALSPTVEGLTISGGEPLQQAAALGRLLAAVRRRTALSVVLFSGFEWEEIEATSGSGEVLAHLDVLIAGRFDQARRVARGLIGSSNKTMHFLTDRYGPEDFGELPEAELIVQSDGSLVLSGIDPLQW